MAITPEQAKAELARRELERRKSQTQQQPKQAQPVMERQNILGQILNVPGAANRSALMGQGYAQGAMNPSQVPTFSGATQQVAPIRTNDIGTFAGDLAVRGPMQAGANLMDVATDPSAMLGLLLGNLPAVQKGAKATAEVVTIKNDTLAGKVVNSLIKPSHKDFLFGKNPGLGVAKEGIVATSMEDLGAKVEKTLSQLKEGSIAIRNTPENINKAVDVSGIRKPLVNILEKLKKTPLTNKAEIGGVENAVTDIENFVSSIDKVGLKKVSISQGYEIKDAVSNMQKWNRESSLGNELNKALKQVYHVVDNAIDTAVPELKDLNSRMANLISAKQSIIHRMEVLQRQEPANWSGLLNLPFAAYRSTIAKTTLGKLLAKSYKTIN